MLREKHWSPLLETRLTCSEMCVEEIWIVTVTTSDAADISESRIELQRRLQCAPRRSITTGKHLACLELSPRDPKVWMQTSHTLSNPLLLPQLHFSLLLVFGSTLISTLRLERSIKGPRPSRSMLGRVPTSWQMSETISLQRRGGYLGS